MQYVMESLPGCVLISVIAPAFVSERPADLLALVVSLVAASRLPILPTVLIGIASAGALRAWVGGLIGGGGGVFRLLFLGGGGGLGEEVFFSPPRPAPPGAS